jgi:hypothetical protein
MPQLSHPDVPVFIVNLPLGSLSAFLRIWLHSSQKLPMHPVATISRARPDVTTRTRSSATR